jgi:hypothetical protein
MLNKTSIYSYLREKEINRTAAEMEGIRCCRFLKWNAALLTTGSVLQSVPNVAMSQLLANTEK